MRFFKAVCVIALVFAVSAVAYAETQSVKVSGDISLRSFARHDFDLASGDNPAATATDDNSTDWATFLQSTAEVQIDADLTDNVSGVIRLINQKVWGNNVYDDQTLANGGELIIPTIDPASGNSYLDRNTLNPLGAGRQDSYAIDVDLAYIELKEFLYSPLTLRIGRQDLWFGKGLIVGANLQNPRNAIYAAEYTAIRSFDAIRATLDYDPWTIDAVFAKIQEGMMKADDDTNLWGVNVGYVFDSYNAEAEAYWFMKQDRLTGSDNTGIRPIAISGVNDNSVHTLGARGSFDPIEDWTVALEGAFQLGEVVLLDNQAFKRERRAFAIDASVECRYFEDQFAWKPVAGLEYIIYSGEEDMGNLTATTTGDYKGWDPMFRGKFDTAIREWQNVFYRTMQNSSPSYTNQHQLLLSGSLEPTDSLTVEGKYGNFWLVKDYITTNTKNYLGAEIDVLTTWDYTEDVSFSLLTAWFIPGSHFQNSNDEIATDIVGSVKLSF